MIESFMYGYDVINLHINPKLLDLAFYIILFVIQISLHLRKVYSSINN